MRISVALFFFIFSSQTLDNRLPIPYLCIKKFFLNLTKEYAGSEIGYQRQNQGYTGDNG